MRDNISISRRELAILFAQVLQAAPEYRPQFFSAEDFAALESFTEILIPTDDTPGAREARCAQFIDFYVNASPAEAKERWREAMQALRTAGFHTASAAERPALVAAMSQEHPAHAAYLLIRQENMFAFFTSKPGTVEFLDYRGNSHNDSFPACTHPEHHRV
jgi:gluconate 2-dehydrogenase gamma chain